ncbi:MAG: glycosyltransferase [Candidatus Hydrogenedentes bacterium]|nr:glycosyltransferase [Candidatus Hydrogenedentota bacterium]
MGEVDTKEIRVLLLHNFLSPYRAPLFDELAGRFDLDVWILGDIRSVREWRADAGDAKFRMRNLPRVSVPLGSRYNVILINPTLPVALSRQRADVIICCAWDTPAAFYASLHAWLTGTPFILWSGSTPAENTLLRRFTRPLVRALVRSATAWLAYGSRAKEYLVSLGARKDKTFLAYNTVETESFAKTAMESDSARLREWLGIKSRYVALYCGNLLDLKGVGDLVEGFGRVCGGGIRTNTDGHGRSTDVDNRFAVMPTAPDITLLLVGSGKHETKFRAMVRELGIESRVIFTGFVAREAMPGYYALADLQVVPSRSEVWGLVINEALACGVPVLATDACGAAPDLLTHGVNGYVVPARNPETLAAAMRDHFDHPERHAAMRDAARASIAPFTMTRAADAFVAAVGCALDMKR